MLRFLAVIWKRSSTQQCATAQQMLQRIRSSQTGWKCSFDAAGLVVFQISARAGKTSCTFADKSGVVVGNVFTGADPDNTKRLGSKLDDRRTSKIVNTEGRDLIENYWGSYIGFIRANGGSDVHVVSAPASKIPCLFRGVGGITIVFSRTEDYLELVADEFSINWDFVIRFILHRGDRYIDGTGLDEVSRILPGECVSFGGRAAVRRLIWDPVKVAASERIEDHGEAVQAIKATTQACTSAWASCYENVILKLSGGLDSSIVLHCLVHSSVPPEIQCLNLVTPGEEGDERVFARLVAGAKGAQLHEMCPDIRKMSIDCDAQIERTALPASLLPNLFYAGVKSHFAATHGASAYFDGNLGDELFLQGFREHSAADYIWDHGVSSQLFRIAYDEARVRKLTIWEVLSAALRSRRKSIPLPFFSEVLEGNLFLSKEVLSSVTVSSLLPAVVPDMHSLPPGKRAHIVLCFPPLRYSDPFGDLAQPDNVSPLHSQPLVELCLRIPTYLMNRGGVGRALAREAFRNELPREIVRRRTKGTSTNLFREALRNNYDVLREMLLDGMLMQEGIVDRRSMERTLANPAALTVPQMSQIPILYSTEAWLRNWSSVAAPKYAAV